MGGRTLGRQHAQERWELALRLLGAVLYPAAGSGVAWAVGAEIQEGWQSSNLFLDPEELEPLARSLLVSLCRFFHGEGCQCPKRSEGLTQHLGKACMARGRFHSCRGSMSCQNEHVCGYSFWVLLTRALVLERAPLVVDSDSTPEGIWALRVQGYELHTSDASTAPTLAPRCPQTLTLVRRVDSDSTPSSCPPRGGHCCRPDTEKT